MREQEAWSRADGEMVGMRVGIVRRGKTCSYERCVKVRVCMYRWQDIECQKGVTGENESKQATRNHAEGVMSIKSNTNLSRVPSPV